MAKHSLIGASSRYRWKECPGSVKLSAGVPNTSSSYAKEGTRAHEVAEIFLKEAVYELLGWRITKKEYDLAKKTMDETPQEMLDEVYVYVTEMENLVKGIIAKGDPKKFTKKCFLLEHKFDMSKSVYPGLYGTSDCIVYDPYDKILHVADYKHGAGLAVDVFENSQLEYYGLGALLATGFPCQEVELIIAQPRCPHPDGPVRTSRIKASKMIEIADQITLEAKATEKDDAPLASGKHCQFCPAAPVRCPILKTKALELAQKEFSPAELPTNDDGEELARILKWIPTLESWAKKVKEYAYGEASLGRIPVGFKLVEKRATRSWSGPQSKIVDGLKHVVEPSTLFDQKLKSPAQVEKLLGPATKSLLDPFVEKKSSGLKLVGVEEKGNPVLPGSSAQAEFDVVPS